MTIPSDEDQGHPTTVTEENAPQPISNSWAMGITVVVICCIALALILALPFLATTPMVTQYFPTQTPPITPTATITSTPTPNATATQRVIQTATAEIFQATATTAAYHWPTLFSDTFDSNKNDWTVGTTDNEYGKISREIKDGKYRWDATAHKGFIGWTTINTKSLADFYISVEAAQVGGSESADYGLIFRKDPNSNLYYFGINRDRQYSLVRRYDDKWTALIEWTFSPAILQDGPNRLIVIANGDDFTFFINNQFVVDFHDDKIKKGTAALAVEVGLADAQATFEFDNLEVRLPKK